MITLNNERGFVKVEDWQEIEELPGFTDHLDHNKHELKDIIGRYIFKDFIKCGLASCHKAHGKGYIVSTKSGPVTNIGHYCGKNHFKIEFEQLSKAFEKDVQMHNYRENIGIFLVRSDYYWDEIRKIRNGSGGADSMYKTSKYLLSMSSACPEEAVSVFLSMVKRRDSNIIKSRVATEQEANDIEELQNKKLPRPYYVEERVGELQGLAFLYPENNLRDLLVVDLEQGFKAIIDLDVDNGQFKDLKNWSEWCLSVEAKIERARQVVLLGVRLLNKANLEKIKELIEGPSKKKEYQKFLDDNV